MIYSYSPFPFYFVIVRQTSPAPTVLNNYDLLFVSQGEAGLPGDRGLAGFEGDQVQVIQLLEKIIYSDLATSVLLLVFTTFDLKWAITLNG